MNLSLSKTLHASCLLFKFTSDNALYLIALRLWSINLVGITRLKKDIGGVETEITKISDKLANPNFLAKAPDDVVAENRRRLEAELLKLDGLRAALSRLN